MACSTPSSFSHVSLAFILFFPPLIYSGTNRATIEINEENNIFKIVYGLSFHNERFDSCIITVGLIFVIGCIDRGCL